MCIRDRASTFSVPTVCIASRCHHDCSYCSRCDLLVGLDGLHVTAVARDGAGQLAVSVESALSVGGCPGCGVVAHSHGRREVRLVDAPCFDRPVELVWRKTPGLTLVPRKTQTVAREVSCWGVPHCTGVSGRRGGLVVNGARFNAR